MNLEDDQRLTKQTRKRDCMLYEQTGYREDRKYLYCGCYMYAEGGCLLSERLLKIQFDEKINRGYVEQ